MPAVKETLRTLVRAPGFAFSVVATLGLAIGANASVFTLVDQVIFRPLPVENPGELVVVSAPPLPVNGPLMTMSSSQARGERGEELKVWGLSYASFVALATRVPAFRDAQAFFDVRATMPVAEHTVEVNALLVTDNYFGMLGIRPAVGRFPSSDDGRTPTEHAVAVLSHGFWQRQFGGDPQIVGRVVLLNGVGLTVLGVAPRDFAGTVLGMRVDIFAPLQIAEAFEDPKLRKMSGRFGMDMSWDSPLFNRLTVVARLAPGVARGDAEKVADVVYHQMQSEAINSLNRPASEQTRKRMATQHLTLLPAGLAGSQQLGTAQMLNTVLSMLMAMVALVLVVAAGNVANLFVARGSQRAREIAIRFALGACRWRLLRDRLVESLTLALLAGGVGFLLSSWLTSLLPLVLGLGEMPPGVSAGPDWRVAAFTACVSAATGVLIWAVSAIQITRRAGLPLLTGSGMTGVRGSGLMLRRSVVLAQIALSTALVCGAFSLTRSLVGLMLVEPGFEIGNLAAFTVTRGAQAYNPDQAREITAELVTRARAIPGVLSAAASSHLPLSGGTERRWLISDDPGMDRAAPVLVDAVQVCPEYFDTLRLPIMIGREFAASDRAQTPGVAVLSESLAGLLFGSRSAVGRRIAFSRADGTDSAVGFANKDAVFDIEVVGVARDVRSHSLRTPPPLTIYQPQSQADSGGRPVSVLFRTQAAALGLQAVQQLVRQVDPSLAVREYAALSHVASGGLSRERLLAALSSAFGALAAALTVIGVLGLTGFLVARRKHEIGVRLALGCSSGAATRLVMREVVWLSAVGTIAGAALYLGASRCLRSMLFELSPTDPATTAGAIAMLAGAALLAGYLPARRAARIDPAVTLRNE